ncbi:BrxA family protein [Thiothrix subterranea]|uniref:DUF1819 family protein n=1 Tax=Thiothrix subterranea TaxID=2735563 RepID=A0AA51MM15_9GAMM|nr:BrxA family protein [Thiothrix subterranea]MDQ5767883.1 DUF1819 family protein [Thiothrix subterranea]WML86658.1 DUF1819 family protein [Thiothrix subterranea]
MIDLVDKIESVLTLNANDYLGDLIGGGLLIAESRTVAATLLQHLPEADWKRLFEVENVLQKPSRHSSIRYARAIRRRLAPLGEDFIRALLQATGQEYVQMLLLAVLIHSPILADFMRLAVMEHKRLYKPALSADSWNFFIAERLGVMPDLGNFSASTLNKIGTNAVRVLVESGYLNSNRQREFQPVYLLPEVRQWLLALNHPELEGVMECTI